MSLSADIPLTDSPDEAVVPLGLRPLVKECPDGGVRAWLNVCGSFCIFFAVLGTQTSVTIYQQEWALNQLSTYPLTKIAWIGAVDCFLSLCLGTPFGVLFDRYGATILLGPSCISCAVSIFLLGHCTQYWHFMACFGILGGISQAAMLTVALGVIGHWFSVRKGLANGIVTMGSSIGTVAFSMLLQGSLVNLGWTWSMNLTGLLVLLCGAIAVLTIKERSRSATPWKQLDLSCFSDSRFLWLSIAIFGCELVLIIGLGIIPIYALEMGHDLTSCIYLITTTSCGSCFGRVLPAYLSDKFGYLNGLTTMGILTLASICIIWVPFGHVSIYALYASVALFGFGTGSFVSIAPSCVAQVCRAEVYGQWIGTLYTAVSLATLVSLPIGAGLSAHFGARISVVVLAAILAVSILALVLARAAYLRWRWVWFTCV